ncbi:unnamed protein product [Rhodiola kirilowii]
MASLGIAEESASRINAVLDGSGAGGSVDDPYHVNNNELTSNLIVCKVLIGQENYGTWRKSMEMALFSRLKLSFINGAYPKPVDLVTREKWQRCNDMIMSWRICSVSEKIVGEILHAKDVITAWKDLESSYAEIDAIKTVQCYAVIENCLCCKQIVDDRQEERVVKFLMGLDECYASIRSNVFSMPEVPKMGTVYGLVLTEESTRKATKERQVEASTLFT